MSSDGKLACVVCEGPSDFPILKAVIERLWPDIDEVRCLQPQLDSLGKPTSRSGGWTEVRAWCEQNSRTLDFLLSDAAGDSIDLLVLSMDVDVAVAAGIENPPATTNSYVTNFESRRISSFQAQVESASERKAGQTGSKVPRFR
jgi:hypothetical protein